MFFFFLNVVIVWKLFCFNSFFKIIYFNGSFDFVVYYKNIFIVRFLKKNNFKINWVLGILVYMVV